MMIKIKYNQINLMDLGIWTLFSIAIMRGLGLLDMNLFVYYIILPGSLFFSFLIYELLKTKVFLNYKSFLLSILILSIIYNSISLLILKFVSLKYREDDILKFLIMFIASIAVSSILYFLVYLIKRILKA